MESLNHRRVFLAVGLAEPHVQRPRQKGGEMKKKREEGGEEGETDKRARTHCQLSQAEREGNKRRHGDNSLGVTHTHAHTH